jgi:hypothetical protein
MCSINHEKKAIFFHIPKTAGTFIRENLEKYYGFKYYQIRRDDHDDYCDINESYYNNIIENYHTPEKIYGIIEYFKKKPHNKKYGLYLYLKNSDYINKITGMTSEKWDSYYKFCFIRNPYDRLISGFNYCSKFLKLKIPFEEYINYSNNVSDFEFLHIFIPQIKHIIDENNNIIIDDVLLFENLENNFKKTLLKIGFSENEIIHSNDKINNNAHDKIISYISNQNILNKVNEILMDDFISLAPEKYKKIENFEEFVTTY